tara:strand:- start:62 stop:493 length:432 start_codon:yes stop_codon:yes gene_type:complete
MTFFYSSLSILFFSGIVLISKHANLYMKNNSAYIENKYTSSKYQIIDNYILKLLKNKDFNETGQELCSIIKKRINSSGLISNKESEYFVFDDTRSKHALIDGSCVLSNGTHRLLIKNNFNISKKNLYLNSCILDKRSTCTFED